MGGAMKQRLLLCAVFLQSSAVNTMQTVYAAQQESQRSVVASKETILKNLEDYCERTQVQNPQHPMIPQLSRAYVLCWSDAREKCHAAYAAVLQHFLR